MADTNDVSHTPGPWQVEKEARNGNEHHHWGTVTNGLFNLVTVWADVSDIERQAEANARLIASAPELLEALKELLASQLALMPPFEAGKGAQDAWADRRAAARNGAAAVIAKAEGQS